MCFELLQLYVIIQTKWYDSQFERVRNLKLIEELVEAFLNGNEEISYAFNQKTKEVISDIPELSTGERQIGNEDNVAEFLVEIPQMTTPEAYDLMSSFAKKQDAEIANQLVEVLNGQKPFSSFKNKIKGQGIENEWYDFENDYAKSKMLTWLTKNEGDL